MHERRGHTSQAINHHQDMVGGLYLLGGVLEVDTSFRFSFSEEMFSFIEEL